MTTKQSLGQHWLHDAKSLAAMLENAHVSPDDTILEIGPGPGSLTKLLVQQAGRVVAVELDEQLAQALPNKVSAANLEIVQQDILQFDLTNLPPGYKVVANIPYYLTSHLIRRLSEASNPPSLVVLLVQKEVAERVAAKPGDMSILSVTAQFYWQVQLGQTVPAVLFTPPPKVDSQILILTRRPKPLFAVNSKQFFRLVRMGFAHRRKTLLNNLILLTGDRQSAEALLRAADIPPQSRAQSLSLENWNSLYTMIAKQ